MPIAVLDASATPTATPAPTMAATSSRRPVTSPTASPIMAAGKMTSMPRRAGSGICAPRITPASVARFHGMNVAPTAPIQYPRSSVRPRRRKWLIDSANDSSVRRWAITARRLRGTGRSQGDRAAE